MQYMHTILTQSILSKKNHYRFLLIFFILNLLDVPFNLSVKLLKN